MKGATPWIRWTLAAAALAAATGCAPPVERRPETAAPAPVAPPPEPAVAKPPPGPAAATAPGSARAAARQQLALDLQYRGDLAGALTQWRVLRVLDPDDPEIQRQLAATRALIRHRATQATAAGAAAESAGDVPAARRAYLRALAAAPTDTTAFDALRRLEGAEVYAVQEARLAKLRARRARAAARAAAPQPGAPSDDGNGNGQEKDYRDTGIALYRAGDYEASVLELKKYLGSFPGDAEAQAVLNRAQQRLPPEPRTPARSTGEGTPALRNPPPSGNIHDAGNTRDAGKAAGSVPPKARPVPPAAVTAADREAAQALYEQGVRVYRQDVGEAIRFWERTLDRDPQHVQAHLRLEQARKIQRRLEAIDRK